MATLKDVANKVGVSVATVSYVLTGRGSVSKEMTQKVLDAVKELGYRPNRKAQAMRTGKSKSIGMILPDLTKPYFPHLAQKIESAARQQGYAVLLVDCQNEVETEPEGFELLVQQGVDGIIWFPMGQEMPVNLKTLNCPLVLLDLVELNGYDSVHCDFIKSASMQAEYAYEMGHRRVGLLAGPQNIESARERRKGFLQGAEGKLDIVWDLEVPFSTELTDEAREAMLARDVTMVICADDLIGIGAMSALQANGLHVPEDISVMGCDNIPWSTLVSPKLTTINQPIEAIGAEAVAILTRKINTPDSTARSTKMDVDLVERESVRRLS
jgi:LacI family transcriptional regulator